MSEAELVRQAQAGRADAYAELVRRWAARVTAVCHSRVRRADVADDLAQETFLRGFRALSTLQDPEKVGPWFLGIALRASLDWLKAKQQSQVPFSALGGGHDLDHLLAGGGTAGAELDDADERLRLLAEIEALPEIYRQVVMLYYYDDLTYRELGGLLGVSTATVNARLTKARALLRERLTDCRR